MSASTPPIAILGAGGLIGQAVGEALLADGFRVVGMARRFTAAQEAIFASGAVTAPLAKLAPSALAELLRESGARVVVNCIGVLQDGPGGSTHEAHEGLVARLVEAIRSLPEPILLIHVSMPGRDEEDATAFARTKRAAERVIVASGLPHVILRPGFVVARAAFGGSALLRALAMLPFRLPAAMSSRPLAVTAVADIAASIGVAAGRFGAGEREQRSVWEIGDPESRELGDVLAAFRSRLGGPRAGLVLPRWSMRLGSLAGDVASRLGWSPPIRSTALRELERGVELSPESWMSETGIRPIPLAAAVTEVAASVQERWFARLFLAKALILATLSGFWLVSGLVALTAAFGAASAILTSHGLPKGVADAITFATSLLDIAIGLAIAHRRSCRFGLLAGIVVSLGYVLAASLVAPGLWVDPLGPLVKIAPAVVLMLVALLILDSR